MPSAIVLYSGRWRGDGSFQKVVDSHKQFLIAPLQRHYSVLVARVARSSDVVVLNQSVGGASASFLATDMFAATTYNVQVRAHNPKGASSWSSRLLVTTPLPTKRPQALGAPGVLASADGCQVYLTVPLPMMDGAGAACHGVESVDVQMLTAASAQWTWCR